MSIIDRLAEQQAWEQFLSYRLMKGRFSWDEFDQADTYVASQQFRRLASRLQQGEPLSVPVRHLVNKMGSGRKRVVYSYTPDEMAMLKAMAFLLYRYDPLLSPNLYSFRRGLTAHNAIRRLVGTIGDRRVWAYKTDIHDYFNTISVPLLLPMLRDVLADDPRLYDFFERMLTDGRASADGNIVSEEHGVMAGTPTSPFLANVYLSEVDRHFHEAGVLYARYSDDIIVFADSRQELDRHIGTLAQMLSKYRLVINPDKVNIYEPGEPFDFLGFRCCGREIDIAEAARRKMKDKIRRKARALDRWRSKHDVAPEKAMRVLISHFNRKFFEGDDPTALTWSRWFFPIINRTEGLHEIDRYLQDYLRFLTTGRHCKANFRTSYARLRELGYRSLVHEFYLG